MASITSLRGERAERQAAKWLDSQGHAHLPKLSLERLYHGVNRGRLYGSVAASASSKVFDRCIPLTYHMNRCSFPGS
jgi:hypothetical protein